MSVDHRARGIHVSSGEGIVAHLPNLTAFAKGDDAQLNELLVRLNALADAPWHEVVRTLTAGIVESNFDTHPDVACVSIGQDRVAALVFGETTLSVTTDGTEHTLDGCDSSTWIDVAIHGIVDRVRAGSQSDSMVVGVLRDGVIPAGGFLLDTAGPMPASGRWTDDHSAASAPPPVPATTAPTQAETITPETEEPPAIPAEQPNNSRPDDDYVTGRLKDMFVRLDERHRVDDSASAEAVFDEDVQTQDTEPSEEPEAPTSEGTSPESDEDGSIQSPTLEDVGEDGQSSDGLETEQSTTSLEADESTAESVATNGSEPQTDLSSTEQPPALTTTGTLAPPRPQLRGLLCPDGHLTNGSDVQCRTCGLSIDPDAEITMGNRPVLGQLTFDDGAVLGVDRPAAIGSDVPSGYEIDGEPATVVRLDDGLGGVSAVQVEVRTVGWDVEIHDMNSENGTYTILHGERQTRTRLRAGQSVVLQDGMTVEVGGRNFTYALGTKS